jgi:hypothetical protein
MAPTATIEIETLDEDVALVKFISLMTLMETMLVFQL